MGIISRVISMRIKTIQAYLELERRVEWEVRAFNNNSYSKFYIKYSAALGGRMVADSTYYLGLLKAKLNSLDMEIASLTTELDKNEKSQQNLLAYEQM